MYSRGFIPFGVTFAFSGASLLIGISVAFDGLISEVAFGSWASSSTRVGILWSFLDLLFFMVLRVLGGDGVVAVMLPGVSSCELYTPRSYIVVNYSIN